MTRQPHDQFAKEYLEELLTSLGKLLRLQVALFGDRNP
jgi:hypothetical protein